MKTYPVCINQKDQPAVLVRDLESELTRILEQQRKDSADNVRRSVANLLESIQK